MGEGAVGDEGGGEGDAAAIRERGWFVLKKVLLNLFYWENNISPEKNLVF